MSFLVTRIVVGVDFEQTGDNALRSAIRLARSIEGGELHPVTVLPQPGKSKVAELSEAIAQASERLRERCHVVAKEVFDDEWEQHTVLHVRVGEPVEEIHQLAVDVEAGVIVVGHKTRSGVERVLLGSVASQLIERAQLPVLVARPNEVRSLPKTPQPEPAREGEDLHAPRSFSSPEALVFSGRRSSHIGGLI